MSATIQVPPASIELTPEVIAFARAVVAIVDGPPKPDTRHVGIRYLFNVRTNRLHNQGCRSVEGSVPLTVEEIDAMTRHVYGCHSCGTSKEDGKQIFDVVLIDAAGVKESVTL